MDKMVFILQVYIFFTFRSFVNGEQNASSFPCIECYGTVGEVTTCGEAIDINFQHKRVNCSGYCMKKIQYFIDQKIGVERNCSEECYEGCSMDLGTGTCIYCCQGKACNDSTAKWPNCLVLVITEIATILSIF
ncbi:hypothetical protein HOLleu_29662 [Holothuria leucospilota]|uniref:Snake toxin/toxin-like domain-containing protein n=1 Tax=Holothuria leucospilota TaxID=206669 RepID=A0A9Q1BP26_HOLLE|nr:hypothetical protein HOLleu_29662 [Holothuria leucospilota]